MPEIGEFLLVMLVGAGLGWSSFSIALKHRPAPVSQFGAISLTTLTYRANQFKAPTEESEKALAKGDHFARSQQECCDVNRLFQLGTL